MLRTHERAKLITEGTISMSTEAAPQQGRDVGLRGKISGSHGSNGGGGVITTEETHQQARRWWCTCPWICYMCGG